MKFLLTAINAKYIHSNPAVYSLRAFAAQYAGEVEIVEYTINNRAEDIMAGIYKEKPDVLAFSCYIWNWNMICELLPEIHKLLPDAPVWLGGPEVSYDAGSILVRFPFLAGIMVGEGEETFLELMHYYKKKDRRLTDIRGIVTDQGSAGKRTPLDLNRIPFFYRDLDDFKNRIVYYESSRGCPYRCSYCLSSIDKSVRLRDMGLVRKELQFFLDHGTAQVKFVDRTFNCNHEHAMAVWSYIHKNDNGVTNFHFEIAADILNEEELLLLGQMRPGLVQLEIGVQSANPQTLHEIRRVMDLERLGKIVGRIRAGKNIHQHLDLIAGLPYEDYASFQNSFNTVYSMRPNQLQLGFLKVLKGSWLHETADRYGIIYRSHPPYEVLYSRWLPYEKIISLKMVEEMVELYFNSGQFLHTLAVLEQAFESPFALFEGLAEYFEEMGFFKHSASRVYRYDILLQFAVSVEPELEELYRELLTFDMYLREKIKSRPGFALDLSGYREGIRKKRRNKTDHVEVFYYPVWQQNVREAHASRNNPYFVLFHYEDRDPLTREAVIEILSDYEKQSE